MLLAPFGEEVAELVVDGLRQHNAHGHQLVAGMPGRDVVHTPALETEDATRTGPSGQRQLVCFARAMIAEPRVVILDEATSSVDSVTEARVQDALLRLLAGRTSFVVAHRLSTILHADQILVLDHGRIIERGSHAELLQVEGVYARSYREFVSAQSTFSRD